MNKGAVVKYGSLFSAEHQCIGIDGYAEKPDESKWQSGTFAISYGECWYYGKITHHDGSISSDEYLVHDLVDYGSNIGCIGIYRNVMYLGKACKNVLHHNINPISW